MDIVELREKHPTFTYHSYDSQLTAAGLQLTFHFSIAPDIAFYPRVTIAGITQQHLDSLAPAHLDQLIFHLGLIEIPSYWKATCSPVIKIEAGSLNEEQRQWWKKLLIKGLGEFFYRNHVNFTPTDFLTIETATATAESEPRNWLPPQPASPARPPAVLVPLGGGKDSIVTLELLKPSPVAVVPFALNPIPAVTKLLQANQSLTPILAQRTLDPTLLELNRQGYLNGHTPFSAYLAFLTYTVATLHGLPYVALSNERSASEGNVSYLGTIVNHQYSKSLEFENDFRDYTRRWLAAATLPSPEYFSFLRPLHELQIGHLFAQLTATDSRLRPIFRSCNVGQKTNSWCGECSKCLFAWLMLFPFLGEAELTQIFGQNLFEKTSLIDEALSLIHPERVKPWECVGSREESRVAFYLSMKWYDKRELPRPVVISHLAPDLAGITDQAAQRLLDDWSVEHNLPPAFAKILTAPLQTLVIYGLGREGWSTYRYLRQQSPEKELILIDKQSLTDLSPSWQTALAQDTRLQYLPESESARVKAAVVYRSAGIPRHQVEHIFPEATISSNTQLCFEMVNKLNAQGRAMAIIGVTGTKGKSTTSAAIHHLLKENGRPAWLGGNLGQPPLDVLATALAESNADSSQPLLLVLELSSHQLSDLSASPTIAVVQDISPEHLDYYADFDEYLTAKSQITRHQTEQDLVFFNEHSVAATELAQLSAGTKIGFGDLSLLTALVDPADLKVVGRHNYHNLLPAILIGRHFGLTNEQLAHALSTFVPLPHRLEQVATIHEVTFINDSLATTPAATIAALTAFKDQPVILIAGGYDRGLDYTDLGPAMLEHHVKALILFKPTGEKIAAAVQAAAPATTLPIQFVTTMPEAVAQAWAQAQPGDVVLLSPASASFGTFQDYADRGHQFAEAANFLIKR